MPARIAKVHARQILDSRGNPTVEVDLTLDNGSFGRSAAPSGASTGSREALELRDGGDEYLGKAVQNAVNGVNGEISSEIVGKDWDQVSLDAFLQQLDGTTSYSRLGANAVLPVSLAFAMACASQRKVPLYQWIGALYGEQNFVLPRPMWNIMNGGAHANWTTDIQEYMIQAVNPQQSYADQMRMAVEIFHTLGKVLKSHALSVQVGNEGGYAPDLESNTQALELILEAIEQAGYTVGRNGDVALALDVAASELFADGMYTLRRDNKTLSSSEMVEWLGELLEKYPIISIEDGLAESDWSAWSEFTQKHGDAIQIVGDDLLVTNPEIISQAVEQQACNALLVKLNQIGTLTQTLLAMKNAKNAGWNSVPSHRSGETEDVFIAHLAVGTGAGQIKTGAPSRTDRTAKYNELIRIAETL